MKLENEILYVEMVEHGAELTRIYNKKTGAEILWNADPKFWKRHSPVLFPNLGKTWHNVVKIQGEQYPTSQHGFARDHDFKCIYAGKEEVKFLLTSTDEMKEALTTLHDWYEKGLINPEVGTTTNGDNANNVKNGTCGIFMGPWWSLGYGNPDSFRNDNNANWQAYPLYTNDGEWNIHMKDVGTTYTMVNKNASDDVKKAIVIMNNVLVRDESTFDTSVAIGWYPLRNTMAATDECEYEYDGLMGILKGESSADDYQQGGSKFNGLYKNLANDAATLSEVISSDYDGSRDLAVTDMDVNTNNGQFNRFYALLIGDRPYATLEPDHKIYSELYYTIDGMDTYWTQISDLEDKSVLQFITGAKSLDEWDQFCTDWHVQGGDQILKLVKDYLAE